MSSVRQPLHPLLTHAPLGGVLTAAVLDVVSFLDGGGHAWAREAYRSGTFVLRFATLMMFLAIASGLLDRTSASTKGTPLRSKVNRHGVIMLAVTAAAIVDNVLRGQVFPGADHTPLAPLLATVVTLAVAVAGAELGGRLTYRAGANVMAGGRATRPVSTPVEHT